MNRLFTLLLLLLSLHCQGRDKPVDILVKSAVILQKTQSISYGLVHKFKYLNHSDTNIYIGNVFLQKDPSDTVFNGCIWLNPNDSVYKFYDLDSIYVVNKKARTATVYNAHNQQQTWPIDNNRRMLLNGFFKNTHVDRDTAGTSSLSLLRDTIIDGNPCYAIFIKFPDDEETTDDVSKIWIDKKSYLPLMRIDYVKFQGNYQYSEWHAKAYQLNAVKAAQFSTKQIPVGYKRKTYVEQVRLPEKLLDSNTIAPDISGKNYTGNLKRDSIRYEGKITLLDFWYMGCFPCIKAIPEIEKLKEKYKETNMQIFGVNAYDNNEAAIKKLPQFLQYNNLRYPIMLVDNNVVENFKVYAWPTFYLIDESGKVLFTYVGYSDELGKELGSAIDKALKK